MSNLYLATGYYLKALDQFQYSPDETLENLNYALSYDEEYAPAHCLMGALQMQYLKDYKEAAHCFEMALIYDASFIDTYKWYIHLCLWIGNLNKAESLINQAAALPAYPKSSIYQAKMMLAEMRGDIAVAIKMTDFGLRGALCDNSTNYFSTQAKRLNAKLPKKRSGKRKKKSKK